MVVWAAVESDEGEAEEEGRTACGVCVCEGAEAVPGTDEETDRVLRVADEDSEEDDTVYGAIPGGAGACSTVEGMDAERERGCSG